MSFKVTKPPKNLLKSVESFFMADIKVIVDKGLTAFEFVNNFNLVKTSKEFLKKGFDKVSHYLTVIPKKTSFKFKVTNDLSDFMVSLLEPQLTNSRVKLATHYNEKVQDLSRRAENLVNLSCGEIFGVSSANILYENGFLYFRWIPSSAKNPRDSHMNFYGNIYKFSSPPLGILPQQEYNCQCGIEVIEHKEFFDMKKVSKGESTDFIKVA